MTPHPTSPARRWRHGVCIAFALLLGSPTVVLGQTNKQAIQLELTIVTAADVNPNEQGQAAPIKVRVYELRSAAAFGQADFSTLHDADHIVLNADMLARDEFILRPGERHIIRRPSYSGTVAIGVLAAYRDLPNATWRALHVLPAAADAAWYRSLLPTPKARLKIELRKQDIHIIDIR